MQDPVRFADEAAVAPEDGVSLSSEMHQLIDQGKALGSAELAWQKARAVYAGRQAGPIAVLGLFAAALAFFALMALVVGALIALAPVLGAWGATAAVAGALLLSALIMAGIAMAKVRSTARLLADRRDVP